MATVTTLGLVEETDHWVLPLEESHVEQCRVDYAFSLIVGSSSSGSFEVRIEQPFTLKGLGDERGFDPEGDPGQMASAMHLLRKRVHGAIAFKDGTLELSFDDGLVLHVPCGERVEAWSVVGPAGLRIVSLPGGDLAVWKPGREDAV